MFDLFKKLMGNATAEQTEDTLTVNLAVTVLLFDAAYADGECSDAEKAHLKETLMTRFKVSGEEIDTLFAEREKERQEHVEFFRYTRYLNQHLTEKEKKRLLASVWRIILLDGQLEAHEDHFVHRLADLLNLGHQELIEAKRKARQQLAQ